MRNSQNIFLVSSPPRTSHLFSCHPLTPYPTYQAAPTPLILHIRSTIQIIRPIDSEEGKLYCNLSFGKCNSLLFYKLLLWFHKIRQSIIYNPHYYHQSFSVMLRWHTLANYLHRMCFLCITKLYKILIYLFIYFSIFRQGHLISNN